MPEKNRDNFEENFTQPIDAEDVVMNLLRKTILPEPRPLNFPEADRE